MRDLGRKAAAAVMAGLMATSAIMPTGIALAETNRPSVGKPTDDGDNHQTGTGITDVTVSYRQNGQTGGTEDPANPDDNGDGYGDNVAFTVPTATNFVSDAQGKLTGPSAATAYIENESAFGIRATAFRATANGDWTLVNDDTETSVTNGVDFQFGPNTSNKAANADAYDYQATAPDKVAIASVEEDAPFASSWDMDPKVMEGTSDRVQLTTTGDLHNVSADITNRTKMAEVHTFITPGGTGGGSQQNSRQRNLSVEVSGNPYTVQYLYEIGEPPSTSNNVSESIGYSGVTTWTWRAKDGSSNGADPWTTWSDVLAELGNPSFSDFTNNYVLVAVDVEYGWVPSSGGDNGGSDPYNPIEDDDTTTTKLTYYTDQSAEKSFKSNAYPMSSDTITSSLGIANGRYTGTDNKTYEIGGWSYRQKGSTDAEPWCFQTWGALLNFVERNQSKQFEKFAEDYELVALATEVGATQNVTTSNMLINGYDFRAAVSAMDDMYYDRNIMGSDRLRGLHYEQNMPDGGYLVSSLDGPAPVFLTMDNSLQEVTMHTMADRVLMNTDSSYMFDGWGEAVSADAMDKFDSSQVTNASHLFSYSILEPASTWDLSNVTNAEAMFDSWYSNQGNPWRFVTAEHMPDALTNTKNMFNRGGTIRDIGIFANVDFSHVTDMSGMFKGCTYLTLDCSGWDVSSVTNYEDFNTGAPNVTPPASW